MARLRLFCFPCAGGGASAYRDWGDALPETVEVYPVQPPGREGRIRQAPYRDLGELVAALDRELSAELDETPHAFFGHGVGAIAAYELARRRAARGSSAPTHLLVSARPAPTLGAERPPIHDLPAELFRERLREVDGASAARLDQPGVTDLLEPLLRADLRVDESYRLRDRGPSLECPVTAFGGFRDHRAPKATLEPWSDVSHGRFRLHMLPGDDYLLHDPGRPHLLRLVRDALEWQLGGRERNGRPAGAPAATNSHEDLDTS